MKRAAVAILLLALLGVAACGGDAESPAPSLVKDAPEPDARRGSAARARLRTDPKRVAPAWLAWQADKAAERKHEAPMPAANERLLRDLRAARGVADVREIIDGLRERWRSQNPTVYGYLALRAVRELNSRDFGLGMAQGVIMREIALDALALEDQIRPGDEAGLAAMLSQQLSWGSDSTRRERGIDWRARLAPHWVRAWSRLVEAWDPEWVPPPIELGIYPPYPKDVPMTGGMAPPYLLDADARAAYDKQLRVWLAAQSHLAKQRLIEHLLARYSPTLWGDLERAYRLKPHDHQGLRKLLAGSSIPEAAVSSILEHVGAND